ncbi:MAG: hypothetical protein B7X43_03455 [Thiomonas sp. 15-63-373]|nr:MAG: hypothetical protein B7X43_03455 [Thiomonas sp. 15-63-373]
MKPLPKWLLALAIVLFAFYLLLIPEFGVAPFWGQRWDAGAPPTWRESSGWWGPRSGYGMMNGPVGDWGALGVQSDHGYGDDGGYGYGMMGGGIWPAARGSWQELVTPHNLLAVNSVAKPDPAAQAKAGAAVAEILRQIVQIRLQAEQQIQVALSAPPLPTASSALSP